RGLAFRRAAWIAPAIRASDWVDGFAAALAFDAAFHQRYRRAVERIIGQPLDAVDLSRVSRAVTCATLIAHDPGDPVSAWADVVRTAATLRHPELMPCAGLGHYRILRDTRVIARAVEHLASASDGQAASGAA